MNLIQIAWKKWRILAICDDDGNCPVLDYLGNIGTNNPGKMSQRILNRLRNRIAENGPEENSEKAKHLDAGICEFREQPSKGPKPRIFYFIDGMNIICTEGFSKRNENLDVFIDRAKDLRSDYFAAKAAGKINAETLPGD